MKAPKIRQDIRILIGVIGLVLLLVIILWRHVSNDKKQAAINSYASCIAAGNPIQETYPEICVAKNGQRFVHPGQSVNTPIAPVQ